MDAAGTGAIDAGLGDGDLRDARDTAEPAVSLGDASVTGLGQIATATASDRPDLPVLGHGDLWPSCWSDDGNLYTAWGDGRGFDSETFVDIGVARLAGSPESNTLKGTNLAVGDAVGQLWHPGQGRTRKPTGIACVAGDLYLAVQDLAQDFNDAPAATIVRSRDKGLTWEWDRAEAMFRNHELTTIFFLDFGQDRQTRENDSYVYAYALDGNWRDSFNDVVADPTHLWLARIPSVSIQDRHAWQWYSGLDDAAAPVWSSETQDRAPVLIDTRRIYTDTTTAATGYQTDLSVISQGSVVYNAPLRKYLYTSWTEYTYEFYEAAHPWGPFRLFFRKDFGVYPWSGIKSGGYGVTIPSKFISDDGLHMYIQSNTFWGGANNYGYSLRKFTLQTNTGDEAENRPGDLIPMIEDGAVIVADSFNRARPQVITDGELTGLFEDSRTGEIRSLDHWGVTWPRNYYVNKLEYTTGEVGEDCGWFDTLNVEIRRANGEWAPVEQLSISPPYPLSIEAGSYRTYSMRFPTIATNGVRVAGRPGGLASCTSIAELAVSYE